MEVERVHRAVGPGFFQYVQETKKKSKSTEKVPLYAHPAEAVCMLPDGVGEHINYLV